MARAAVQRIPRNDEAEQAAWPSGLSC